jgi:hypothetical protein
METFKAYKNLRIGVHYERDEDSLGNFPNEEYLELE